MMGWRAGRLVLTLWLLVTLVFFAMQFAPGSATDTLISAGATPEVIAALKRDLGVDRPVWQQYFSYMGDLARGDLGTSWRNGTKVGSQLVGAFSHTLVLALAAMVVAMLVGIVPGVMAAIYRDKTFDVVARVVALVGISVPIFVINILAIYYFAFKLPIFPTSGSQTTDSLVLPAVTLGLFVGAMMLRLVRSVTLEVLSQEYIRAALARGVPRTRLVWRHIVPNILISIVTLLGAQFGLLLGGSVITETVFAWPGLGQMTIQAIKAKDIPVLQGAVTVFAGSFMLVNFAVDLLYSVLDPRVAANR